MPYFPGWAAHRRRAILDRRHRRRVRRRYRRHRLRLAYRILEAGYRLNIPRMFAALILISLTGILIFLAFTLLQHLALRHWHGERRPPGER